MSFEKKVWVNVPDPNNPPEIPEGQDALARFDADNMNRIEDGIKDAHDENVRNAQKIEDMNVLIEEKFGVVKDIYNPTETYSFTPLAKAYYSRLNQYFYGSAALSPNGRYLAVISYDYGNLILYRTEDMAVVGSLPINKYGSRIEMDNNFGVVSYNTGDSNYFSSSYKGDSYYGLVFFKYDDTSITSIDNSNQIKGRLPYRERCAGFSQAIDGDSEYFWFLLEDSSSTKLYRMDKTYHSSMIVKSYPKTTNGYFKELKLYRDKDSVVIMGCEAEGLTCYSTYTKVYVPYNFSVFVERVFEDGSSNQVFYLNHKGNCDGKSFPYPMVVDYEPSEGVVVIGGACRHYASSSASSLSYYSKTNVYSLDGSIIRTTDSHTEIVPNNGYNSDSYYNKDSTYFIRDGMLYYEDYEIDLETLESRLSSDSKDGVFSSRVITGNNFSGFSNTVNKDVFYLAKYKIAFNIPDSSLSCFLIIPGVSIIADGCWIKN